MTITNTRNFAKNLLLACLLLSSVRIVWASEFFPGAQATGLFEFAAIPRSATNKLKGTIWWTVAAERGLDAHLLYAVALVESARISKRLAAPWPWVSNGVEKFPLKSVE